MITHGECIDAPGRAVPGPRIPPLRDGRGRALEYLRLSVTDRCNFRCRYCLPHGRARDAARAEPLSLDELGRLVRAFAGLGFWKVRLTGGEPTIRSDILELVRRTASTPGVRHVGMTTNGHRLVELAGALADGGLTCLNVSVDSLDPARFADLTGVGRLDRVLAGVDAAIAAGIPRVKVNAVLLAGVTGELDAFLAWVRERPVTVRFIELMRTGDDPGFFERNHVPGTEIARRLVERGWARLPRAEGAGPAVNYGHPDHLGRIGIIAPYGESFCASCNRLRVSAAGDLKLCLFADRAIPLRPLLAADGQADALAAAVRAAVGAKPAAHRLHEGHVGSVRNLAAIGG